MGRGEFAMEGDAVRAATGVEPPASRYGWYVATVLMLSYAVQHVDRQIISICMEPLRQDLGLSDSQLGLLSGLSFALAYSIAVLPLGALADRTNRRTMLATLLVIWSLLTAMGSLARNFWHLLAVRIGVGMAESGANPAAVSMLADYFPLSRRSAAIGLYFFGQGLGILGGFAIGGYVAFSFGWRGAFLIAGVPGLLLALLMLLTVRDAPRAAAAAANEGQATWPDVLARVRRTRSLVLMMTGGVLSAVVVAAFVVWIAALLIRTHGINVAQAGLAVGLGLGLAGATGAMAGGFASDRLARRGFRMVPIFVGCTILLSTPLFLGALAAPGAAGTILLASLGLAMAHAKDGPSFSAITTLARPAMRARTVSLMTLTTNLVGFGVGPQIVGLLSDLYRPFAGGASLQFALGTVVLIGLPAGLVCLLAARTAEADLAGEAPTRP